MTRELSQSVSFVIGEDDSGERLDKVIARRTALGRKAVRTLFDAGRVFMAGRRVSAGTAARVGTEVRIRADERRDAQMSHHRGELEQISEELRIVLQNESLVVVDKPAGMPSAPLTDKTEVTLAHALLQRFPEMRGIGYSTAEAGLIHRLDTYTSGLVVAARSRLAFEHLKQALQAGLLEKSYYAVVSSAVKLAQGTVSEPLKPSPHNKRKVVVARREDHKAYPARTDFKVVTRGRVWSLLEVSAPKAYRHQIRAHLAHLGAPLAGDVLYGGEAVESLGKRHALHAHYVAWAGDELVRPFAAACALPPELLALLD